MKQYIIYKQVKKYFFYKLAMIWKIKNITMSYNLKQTWENNRIQLFKNV